MHIINTTLQLIGSLGFLLYGMSLMSNGIQKSAGEKLQSALGFMTGNRFIAMLTGVVITMLVQSSGATTVMVVSFVNAGLITLAQSAGVIFGANIGTTITAWIVALFGFNFNIEAFAVPIFGLGFLLTITKRLRQQNLGEAIMGFALLFVGLSMLSETITFQDPNALSFLTKFQHVAILSIIIAVASGIMLTALLHSSSALTAIVITMAYSGLLSWEFSCAMVIGSNIGSTIDAILAAFGTKANARRACFIHVMFNVVGTILALIFFNPLLALVDFLVPGPVESNITYHIAMIHTTFNMLTALMFIPFVNQVVALVEKVIKPNKNELQHEYHLEPISEIKGNAAIGIIRTEKEIADMCDIISEMFDHIQIGFTHRDQSFTDTHFVQLKQAEDYINQMYEQLAHYIVQCEHLPATERQLNNLSIMLQIVDEVETMSDDCLDIGSLLQESISKKMSFPQEDLDDIIPYMELARQFLQFIHININKRLGKEKLEFANSLRTQIVTIRKTLKERARKRLESGVNVKSELLYIDLVRNIGKIGNRALAISKLLSQTK